jgi:hypothetical protein
MTDPALALILAIVFLGALAVVRWFKTLDAGFWHAWRTALPAGAIGGVLLRFIGTNAVTVGIVLTIAALYVRLTGQESEPSDGMIFGAAAGDAAALALIFLGRGTGTGLAACLLAGAVAGFGVTIAAMHPGKKLRQFVIDTVTMLMAMAAAELPLYALHALPRQLDDRRLAIGAAVAIPLLVILTVFKQWRDVKAELSHEASLGFIDAADVRPTAHPLLRLGRGGWTDPNAHRVFVRLATLLALRKRQQRRRAEEVARLYQLEIIKLRMQIQEMARIDHAVAAERVKSEG